MVAAAGRRRLGHVRRLPPGIARSEGRTSLPALEVVAGAGPALHVDGKTDVVFRAGGTYERYSAEGFCSNMACHPGETKAWPR